jgi:hypothetical protein
MNPHLLLHLSDGRCAARETINRKYSNRIRHCYSKLEYSHGIHARARRRRPLVIMSSSRIRSGVCTARPRARPLASRATLGLVPTRRAEMCPWRCPITHETSVPCTPPVAPRGIYTGAVGNHTRPPGHLEHLALSRHRAGETREVGLRPSPSESHASTHEMIHCGVGATARGGGRARQGGTAPGECTSHRRRRCMQWSYSHAISMPSE